MSDFLVNLGTNKIARAVIKGFGLPIPLPQKLKRAKGPWEERPLQDRQVIVGHGRLGGLAPALAGALFRGMPALLSRGHSLRSAHGS